MTTVANDFWASAPVPVASAIGKKPTEATSAVMTTGRSLISVPAHLRDGRLPFSRLIWFGPSANERPATCGLRVPASLGRRGRWDWQVLERLDIYAHGVRRSDHDWKAAIALEHHTCFAAADGGSDHVLDGEQAETKPGNFRIVDLDFQKRESGGLFHAHVLCGFDPAQNTRDLIRRTQHRLEILAENFYRQIAAHAGEKLIDRI